MSPPDSGPPLPISGISAPLGVRLPRASRDHVRSCCRYLRQLDSIQPLTSKGHRLRNKHHVYYEDPRMMPLAPQQVAGGPLVKGMNDRNHVMNAVGSKMLPHFDEIHDRVEQRQKQRGQAEELFLRLTGLKMKMEQYALGEKFAGRVADARGVAFLNRAWQSAEWLPTEAEIRAPDRWIERMDRDTGMAGREAAGRAS